MKEIQLVTLDNSGFQQWSNVKFKEPRANAEKQKPDAIKEQTAIEKINLLQVAVVGLVLSRKFKAVITQKHLILGKSQSYKESQSFHAIRLLKQKEKKKEFSLNFSIATLNDSIEILAQEWLL